MRKIPADRRIGVGTLPEMLALLAQRFYDLDIVLALLAHQLFPTCSLCGSCWMAVEHEFAVCSDIASADFVCKSSSAFFKVIIAFCGKG